MSKIQQVGRIAFRVEDDKWVAYYALPHTMDGALWLGAIKMRLVEDERRKRAFMHMMRSAIGDFLKDATGQDIERWNTQPAPENERKL